MAHTAPRVVDGGPRYYSFTVGSFDTVESVGVRPLEFAGSVTMSLRRSCADAASEIGSTTTPNGRAGVINAPSQLTPGTYDIVMTGISPGMTYAIY